MDEDVKLVEDFKSGDIKAFESLVQKYKNSVFVTAVGILNNPNDADDAAQEVFMKVYNSINSFKFKSSFSTWLYRITVNKCYDALKRRKHTLSLDSDISAETLVSDGDNPAVQKDNLIKIKKANELLNQLPKNYRTAVVLKEINNMRYAEIAEAMEISVDNVKVLLFRARNMLKKLNGEADNELR